MALCSKLGEDCFAPFVWRKGGTDAEDTWSPPISPGSPIFCFVFSWSPWQALSYCSRVGYLVMQCGKMNGKQELPALRTQDNICLQGVLRAVLCFSSWAGHQARLRCSVLLTFLVACLVGASFFLFFKQLQHKGCPVQCGKAEDGGVQLLRWWPALSSG